MPHESQMDRQSAGGSAKLLLVDDDRQVLWSVERLLRSEGFCCHTAATATQAQAELERAEFDLVLLDLCLPDLDGMVLLRRLRAQSYIPVVLLTARDAMSDRVLGLEVGADDYVVKPFDPRELIARIRAQLRRAREYGAPSAPAREIRVGELRLDLDGRQAFMAGRKLELTAREFEVLLALARTPGRAVTADWLYEHVWGYSADLAGKSPAVYMRRLRRKVERDPDHPEYLRTVRGYGYRLAAPEQPATLAP